MANADRHRRWRTLVALAGCAVVTAAQAASASAQFTVTVRWQPHPTGICTSETLSAATGAVVQVVCASGQFVSIEPRPGQPFGFTHGGAYRFHFGPGVSVAEPAAPGPGSLAFSGAGTVTAMRVQRAGGATDDPVEMLITF